MLRTPYACLLSWAVLVSSTLPAQQNETPLPLTRVTLDRLIRTTVDNALLNNEEEKLTESEMSELIVNITHLVQAELRDEEGSELDDSELEDVEAALAAKIQVATGDLLEKRGREVMQYESAAERLKDLLRDNLPDVDEADQEALNETKLSLEAKHFLSQHYKSLEKMMAHFEECPTCFSFAERLGFDTPVPGVASRLPPLARIECRFFGEPMVRYFVDDNNVIHAVSFTGQQRPVGNKMPPARPPFAWDYVIPGMRYGVTPDGRIMTLGPAGFFQVGMATNL